MSGSERSLRIAVCHPHTPFTRGGAEMHTDSLARALRDAGHETEIVSIPWKWYPPSELVHQMGLWRSLDLSEAGGRSIDMVIALRFPAYLVKHERKVVWLIHQHRTAYELWDHPQFADLSRHEDGAVVRDMIWQADRVGLGEAKRIFTNSGNVRDRLDATLGIPAEPLYHRSQMTERLLEEESSPPGPYVLYPSRLEPIKRQRLVIEAMRMVRTPVRLVLVGGGFDEAALRRQIAEARLDDRVTLEGGVSDDRLSGLYREALGVYYGPFDEDFGYVTLEAMAARRPLVVPRDSGGPLEFVRDGESGIVVDAEPEAIAASLDRLYGDRDEAARMGEAGRAVLDRSVPQWPEVVSRLLS
ncbi:MAG TPA: glycosyltransferase family 4 protein [Actinomycetota bacterium]